MNQAEVAKLMSQLKITVKPKWRHLKTQLVRKETSIKKYFFLKFPIHFPALRRIRSRQSEIRQA